jgi:hypothetical protein
MSKNSKFASHNDSSESTQVSDEKLEKDKSNGKGFKFRIFKAPKSGRVIKRIDILTEGWSSRVFKDLNTNVSPPKFSLANTLLEGFVSLEFPISLVWSPFVFPSKGPEGKVIMSASRKPFSHATTIYFSDGSEISLWPRTYLGMWEWHDFDVPEHRKWYSSSPSVSDSQASVKSGGIEC